MSTRSQKRKTNHQNGTENVSENLVSPVLVGGMDPSEPDVMVAGPSKDKSSSVENSILDLRISAMTFNPRCNWEHSAPENLTKIRICRKIIAKSKTKFISWNRQ